MMEVVVLALVTPLSLWVGVKLLTECGYVLWMSMGTLWV